MNTIANLLRVEDIHLELQVTSKNEFLDRIGQVLESMHRLPQRLVAAGLQRREAIGSTALGKGGAIPHARVKGLDRIIVSYVGLGTPIPFDAPDGEPVSDLLVLLVPKQATEEHLGLLAEAMQMFSSDRFRQQLHNCATPQQFKAKFDAWQE